jgi:hypothetical protein
MWPAMARAFGLLSLTLALAPAAAGQAGQISGARAAPRWEYAILRPPIGYQTPVETTEGGKVTKTYRRVIRVCVAQANGCQYRDIERTFAIVHESGARPPDEGTLQADLANDSLANALEQLGAEGWELVIQGVRMPLGTSLDLPVLYFKRQAR